MFETYQTCIWYFSICFYWHVCDSSFTVVWSVLGYLVFVTLSLHPISVCWSLLRRVLWQTCLCITDLVLPFPAWRKSHVSLRRTLFCLHWVQHNPHLPLPAPGLHTIPVTSQKNIMQKGALPLVTDLMGIKYSPFTFEILTTTWINAACVWIQTFWVVRFRCDSYDSLIPGSDLCPLALLFVLLAAR